MIQEEALGRGDPIGPLDWRRGLPFEPAAASDRRGWVGLQPGVVARAAAEAFDLDPARVSVPPLDGLDLPTLRAAMRAVDAELTAGAAGGQLAAEALATVLAVQLLRQVLAPR